MFNYRVGQVLYMANDNTLRVIPVQVVEEIIRTTLNGKEKTYNIQLPDKKNTVIDIKKVKGNLFTSADQVRNHMIKNATEAIDMMIQKAKDIKDVAFTSDKEETDKAHHPKEDNGLRVSLPADYVQQETKDDIINIVLDDGTSAKFNPKDLQKVGAI